MANGLQGETKKSKQKRLCGNINPVIAKIELEQNILKTNELAKR